MKKIKGEPLTPAQITFVAIYIIVIFAAITFGVLCMFFNHLTEGIIIFGCTLFLIIMLPEIIRLDRKDNLKKLMKRMGSLKTSIKNVEIEWSDGVQNIGNVEFRDGGVLIECEDGRNSYVWDRVTYKTEGDIVKFKFGDTEEIKFLYQSDLQKMAVEKFVTSKLVSENIK